MGLRHFDKHNANVMIKWTEEQLTVLQVGRFIFLIAAQSDNVHIIMLLIGTYKHM